MTTAGAEVPAADVAAADAVALESPTAAGVASLAGSADGDGAGADEDAGVPASLLEGVTADEAAVARVSTVKELPIETSTATPGADSFVSPAVLANTTAA